MGQILDGSRFDDLFAERLVNFVDLLVLIIATVIATASVYVLSGAHRDRPDD